jgi:hypothetical protein
MCYYITLIAPTGNQPAIRSVMQKHKRAAMPFDNSSVAKILLAAERQYLTTRGTCDCGTVLAPDDVPACDDFETELVREGLMLRRRGWPETRIARAIDDRRLAYEREKRAAPDSLDLWARIISELHKELSLPYVGLLVHLYDGRVDDEEFPVTRRTAASRCSQIEQLESLRPDEVTIFNKA